MRGSKLYRRQTTLWCSTIRRSRVSAAPTYTFLKFVSTPHVIYTKIHPLADPHESETPNAASVTEVAEINERSASLGLSPGLRKAVERLGAVGKNGRIEARGTAGRRPRDHVVSRVVGERLADNSSFLRSAATFPATFHLVAAVVHPATASQPRDKLGRFCFQTAKLWLSKGDSAPVLPCPRCRPLCDNRKHCPILQLGLYRFSLGGRSRSYKIDYSRS